MDLVLVVQMVLAAAIAGCCVVLIFVGPQRAAGEQESPSIKGGRGPS